MSHFGKELQLQKHQMMQNTKKIWQQMMKKQPDIFQGVQQRIKKEEEEQKINEHIVDIKANQVHTNNYKGNYAG